jgi:hypothetical protein
MKKGTTGSGKKKTKSDPRVGDDDILPEYDFSRAGPNRYAQRYAGAANIVALDPDVAAVFPDAEAVNRALLPIDIRRGRRHRCASGRARARLPVGGPIHP